MSLENLNAKELRIYSTTRHKKTNFKQESICPPSMTRSEFFNKVVYYPHKVLLPKNVRKLLLGSILEEYDKQTNKLSRSHLVFEKNFLAYLQSSAFFLQFYDELFIHNIDIADIPLQDTYGDYEEHLHILQEIFARYNTFLDSKNLVYKSREYEIVSAWVKNFSRIVICLDSVLNPYEKEILTKVSRFCEVVICFQTQDAHPHSKDAKQELTAKITHTLNNIDTHFLQIFDKSLALEPFTYYEVRYPQGEIISKKPCPIINTHISAKSFFGHIEQVGGVRECIKHWLDRGILPQDIAIVLPDSHFLRYLQTLDKEHNFNYAMGKKFSEDMLFKEIQLAVEELESCNIEELHNIISQNFKTTENAKYGRISEDVMQILYDYKRTQEFLPLKDMGKSFLQDIGDLRIDDNRGGKISVIEVLESRGLNLKYVIVPDCNEDKIPSLSTSDMFLTTAIRERLHIPTVYDKRALQIWHYKSLLFGAKEACMLLVDSQDCAPCILLNALNITPTKSTASIFKHQLAPMPYKQESYYAPLGFDFSPSSLNVLLACPQQYYFKHIANLCLPDLDSKNNAIYGNIIHEVLHESYKAYRGKIIDIQTIHNIKDTCMHKLAKREFQNSNTLSGLQNIHIEKMLFEMEAFFAKECEFIKQNGAFTLLELEKEFRFVFASYAFKGRIDRIQKNQDNSILVIDYKYKTFDNNSKDIALEIYRQYIAQEYLKSEVRVSFYFLKEDSKEKGKLCKTQENMQEELTQQLNELDKKFCHTKAQILSQGKDNYVIEDSLGHNLQSRYGEFEPLGREHKTKICKYCDYRTLCGI